MKTIAPFKTWLINQGLDKELDKEKRKEVHAYYRKNIYSKEYESRRKNRHRITINLTENELIQIKAKAIEAGEQVAGFSKKRIMNSLSGNNVYFSKTLTTVMQLLSLCRNDLGYLINKDGESSRVMLQSFENRLHEIEEHLNILARQRQ